MESGQLSFSVEGAFIMDLARDGYWFEDRREWALNVLSCLQGMTVDQALKVLNGDAVLSGVDSKTSKIEYDEIEDEKFKAKLTKHKKWLADEVAKEEAKKKAELEAALKREEARESVREHRSFWMQPRPEKPREIVVPKNPVKLGKYQVEKSLLDEYVGIAVEHDLLGVTDAKWDAGTALVLSGQMMKIHLILRESVGLEGYWGLKPGTYEPDEFDLALQKIIEAEVKKDSRDKERKRLHRMGISITDRLVGGEA
jgi:hypothetical protein